MSACESPPDAVPSSTPGTDSEPALSALSSTAAPVRNPLGPGVEVVCYPVDDSRGSLGRLARVVHRSTAPDCATGGGIVAGTWPSQSLLFPPTRSSASYKECLLPARCRGKHSALDAVDPGRHWRFLDRIARDRWDIGIDTGLVLPAGRARGCSQGRGTIPSSSPRSCGPSLAWSFSRSTSSSILTSPRSSNRRRGPSTAPERSSTSSPLLSTPNPARST